METRRRSAADLNRRRRTVSSPPIEPENQPIGTSPAARVDEHETGQEGIEARSVSGAAPRRDALRGEAVWHIEQARSMSGLDTTEDLFPDLRIP